MYVSVPGVFYGSSFEINGNAELVYLSFRKKIFNCSFYSHAVLVMNTGYDGGFP